MGTELTGMHPFVTYRQCGLRTCPAALVEFSGEEGHGRFLDLHAVYDIYLNLGFVKEKIDYTDCEYYSTVLSHLGKPHPQIDVRTN